MPKSDVAIGILNEPPYTECPSESLRTTEANARGMGTQMKIKQIIIHGMKYFQMLNVV